MPLWKYGGRAASPRSTGPLNLPMSAHLPVNRARPGSVVRTVAPVALWRSVYSGMSGVRRSASVRPMSSGRPTEWLPTFGVLWQLLQVPATSAWPSTSLKPPTPEMVSGRLLNSASPRTIAARARPRCDPSSAHAPSPHAANRLIAPGSNSEPVGSPPSVSLMPMWKRCVDSARGPPSASSVLR